MVLLAEAKNITYECFNLDALEETALIVGQAFSGSDPMAIIQNLSVQDFQHYVEMLEEWLADADLSVIARDKTSGKVAGALIAGDFAADSPLEVEQVSHKFAPIFALFQSLEDSYKQDKLIKQNEYLHLYMLAVAPQNRGKGIAHTLVSTALELGMKRGYEAALTEAANPISQHIFRKAGFVPRHEIRYSQFVYERDGFRPAPGHRVFEGIVNASGTVLMDKLLHNSGFTA